MARADEYRHRPAGGARSVILAISACLSGAPGNPARTPVPRWYIRAASGSPGPSITGLPRRPPGDVNRPLPADDTWSLIRAELERAVSDSVFHIWIEPLRLRGQDGNTLLLEAPDEIRTWVCDRFGGVLRSCTRSVLGPDADIAIGTPDRAHD